MSADHVQLLEMLEDYLWQSDVLEHLPFYEEQLTRLSEVSENQVFQSEVLVEQPLLSGGQLSACI